MGPHAEGGCSTYRLQDLPIQETSSDPARSERVLRVTPFLASRPGRRFPEQNRGSLPVGMAPDRHRSQTRLPSLGASPRALPSSTRDRRDRRDRLIMTTVVTAGPAPHGNPLRGASRERRLPLLNWGSLRRSQKPLASRDDRSGCHSSLSGAPRHGETRDALARLLPAPSPARGK